MRERRHRREFAEVVREFVDQRYLDAGRVRLVCDDLNTHDEASLYVAFAPAGAQRLAAKIEFNYTPPHGSWLNVVECEFAVFVHQCLQNGRRGIGTVEALRAEACAWAAAPNGVGGWGAVDW